MFYFSFKMSIWNSNLLHRRLFGNTNTASYTLDFFADDVSKKVISMNAVIYYDGEEYVLENVISNGQNNLYVILSSTDMDQATAEEIVMKIMQSLWSEGFVVPKVTVV